MSKLIVKRNNFVFPKYSLTLSFKTRKIYHCMEFINGSQKGKNNTIEFQWWYNILCYNNILTCYVTKNILLNISVLKAYIKDRKCEILVITKADVNLPDAYNKNGV